MKRIFLGLLVSISLFFVSCADNDASLGAIVQPDGDIIEFAADTFHVSTDTMLVDYVYAIPDSFLLGYYHNEIYGSTRADIFAQVKAPIGFEFNMNQLNLTFDSARIALSYYSWFGDGNSPMRISIYEMKGEPFTFLGTYPSNLNVDDYADFTKPLASQVIVAKDTARYDSTAVIFKLSNDFVQRFRPANEKVTYASDENFFNFFKGLYITTDFGSSALLAVGSLVLSYYYSYDIVTPDSTYRISQLVSFPANSEVRQVNRIQHPNRQNVVKPEAGKSYVSSPANIFTRVQIPLKRINDRMNDSIKNKNLMINEATLKVEVTDFENVKYGMSPPNYMLLIKKDALDRNYARNRIPASAIDTAAIYASYQMSINSDGDTTRYYSFNLASLISEEIRNAKKTESVLPEKLDMVLLPMTPEYTTISSTTSITSAKHMIPMSAVTIRGGSNNESPMRIRIAYSGF